MEEYKIGCVVMAAGNAARFGENKLAACFEGKPLIAHALDAVPQGLQSVVVTQYDEVAQMAQARGFHTIRNAHPDWGISHTIRLGMQALLGCDAIVFMVSDQPLLRNSSVLRVIDMWRAHPSCIVGAAHRGKRGNPCIFPRAFFDELLRLQGDRGGNTVIHNHPDVLLTVEIDESELTDVDTPKALNDLVSGALCIHERP